MCMHFISTREGMKPLSKPTSDAIELDMRNDDETDENNNSELDQQDESGDQNRKEKPDDAGSTGSNENSESEESESREVDADEQQPQQTGEPVKKKRGRPPKNSKSVKIDVNKEIAVPDVIFESKHRRYLSVYSSQPISRIVFHVDVTSIQFSDSNR